MKLYDGSLCYLNKAIVFKRCNVLYHFIKEYSDNYTPNVSKTTEKAVDTGGLDDDLGGLDDGNGGLDGGLQDNGRDGKDNKNRKKGLFIDLTDVGNGSKI